MHKLILPWQLNANIIQSDLHCIRGIDYLNLVDDFADECLVTAPHAGQMLYVPV